MLIKLTQLDDRTPCFVESSAIVAIYSLAPTEGTPPYSGPQPLRTRVDYSQAQNGLPGRAAICTVLVMEDPASIRAMFP